MLDRSLPKLWRYHPRVQVIQEEAFYEGFPASHPYLIEDVGEVILHRVLGDKERRGHLLSRGASQDEIHYFSLARAEPVSGRLEPGYSSRSCGFDNDHVLAGIPWPGLCKGALQRQPPAGAGFHGEARDRSRIPVRLWPQCLLQRAHHHPDRLGKAPAFLPIGSQISQ